MEIYVFGMMMESLCLSIKSFGGQAIVVHACSVFSFGASF